MRRPALLLALAVLLAFGGSVLRGGLAFDDAEAIAGNADQRAHLAWTESWTRDYWTHAGAAGHWRPLAATSLRIDRWLWGADTRGFHLTNLLAHLGVALLALALARRLGLPPPVALAGALVFAVHPLQADCVAWISGRAGVLSALAGLAGVYGVARASERGRWGAVLACAALGTFGALAAREDGFVFGLVAIAVARAPERVRGQASDRDPTCERARARATRLGAVAGAALAVAAAGAFRWHVYGSPLPSAPHAPLAGEPLALRLAAGGRSLLELGRALVLPVELSPTYRAASGFGADAALFPSLLGWLPWLALLGLGARRLRTVTGASALLAALSLLPVLQLVPAGELFAPRFAYLPLLLGLPLTGVLTQRLLALLPAVALRRAVAVVALAVLVLQSERASRAYASRAAWAEAVLAVVPDDARAWNDLGVARDERSDLPGARDAWRTAAALDRTYGRPWSNLGAALVREGQPELARPALERAVELGPANPVARCNLGATLLRLGEPEEAARHYARAAELAPELLPAWRGLTNARLTAGELEGARAALERALALAPDDPGVSRLAERLAGRR